MIEDTRLTWQSEEWGAAYLWSDGTMWSDAYFWSDAYMWSDMVEDANPLMDLDAAGLDVNDDPQ